MRLARAKWQAGGWAAALVACPLAFADEQAGRAGTPARENATTAARQGSPGTPSRLGLRFGTASRIGSANPPATHPVIVWQAATPSWGANGWWWGAPGWCGWGPEWGYAPRLGYWLRDDYGPVMMGAVSTVEVRPVDPNLGLSEPAAEPPPPPADEGIEALRGGDWDRAARVYERRLRESPDQLDWARLQAVALAGAGRLDRAAGTLGAAMTRDPSLGSRPMDLGFLGKEALRKLVVAASGYANSAPSGEAWLLVACLMQSEGRREQALRMAQQAEAAGLSEPVASVLLQALAPEGGSGAAGRAPN